jgi:predicted dehydrogenase
MKQYRIAFAGFRHSHIFDLYDRARAHPRLSLAGTCEDNPAESLLAERNIRPDYRELGELLAATPCHIVALGGCYGERGQTAACALEAGCHVISDKPLCTSLEDLERIEKLVWDKGLKVGLMLTMRDHGNMRALHEVVQSGRLGKIQTIAACGQHPLWRGRRPAWYFEPGRHGGTLNDIGVHAIDLAAWLTGAAVSGIAGVRSWNAKASFAPHFRDCAQFMLAMSDGTGLLADVSYLAPDSCGFSLPHYWRITVHGTRGMAETAWHSEGVLVADENHSAPVAIPPAKANPGGYLEDFLADLDGTAHPSRRHTASCLAATRTALELEQQASRP